MTTYRTIQNFSLVVSLIIVFPACADAQFGGLLGGKEIQTVSTEDLDEMLTKQQQAEAKAKELGQPLPAADFVLVDVRSAAEVNVSLIPGAITQEQYEKNAGDYRDRLVIPYCAVGGRSSAYARKLDQAGVKVQNYKGSILEWVQAEKPLVTLDGQSTNRVNINSARYRIPAKYEAATE